MRLNVTLISPQTDTYHHKAYIDTVIHNERENGESILKPEGWFYGLTCRDASAGGLTSWTRLMISLLHYLQMNKTGLNRLSRFSAVKKWCLGLNLTNKSFICANY